jgi:hypothetical protein
MQSYNLEHLEENINSYLTFNKGLNNHLYDRYSSDGDPINLTSFQGTKKTNSDLWNSNFEYFNTWYPYYLTDEEKIQRYRYMKNML